MSSPVFVTLLDLFNNPVRVNTQDNIASLEAIPLIQLPPGVLAGTAIEFDDRTLLVQGTVTATAAAIAAAAGGGFLPTGAMFFAQMPGDNAATIAQGAPVLFPQDGAAYGATPPISTTSSAFTVPEAGTYLVSFMASVAEAGQLQLWRGLAGLTVVPESTASRAQGTTLISNTVLLALVANEILSVRNPTGNATALTMTPADGNLTHAVGATLTIVRVG